MNRRSGYPPGGGVSDIAVSYDYGFSKWEGCVGYAVVDVGGSSETIVDVELLQSSGQKEHHLMWVLLLSDDLG